MSKRLASNPKLRLSLLLVQAREDDLKYCVLAPKRGSHSFRSKNGHRGARRSAHHRKRCVDCNKKYPKSSKFCPACGSGSWRATEH